MSDQDLGRFEEGFRNWRKILATAPIEKRLTIFNNAAVEVASYVAKGLDRVLAADELTDIANAHGFNDDEAQTIIGHAFQQIEQVERTGNGYDPSYIEAPPPSVSPLVLVNIRAWQGTEPKSRQWAVHERIPAANVTLLTGHGGVGKTLLMQQLSVATVLGRGWLDQVPELGPVLFVTAEDDEDELHFRYHRIAQFYGTDFDELAGAGLNLHSLAGKDAVMAIADNRGIVKSTELFERMKATAREIRPRWIGLDTAADIFVVNERDRSQVRQCISLLRGLALELNTAVILLAHPSLSGISSGSGLSGSTAWNNSVRSRLYLKTEKKKADAADNEEGEESEANGGARVLEFMKSNYSALAAPIKLVWHDGLLVPEATLASLPQITRAALEQNARDVFMSLLIRYNQQDRPVSYKPNANNFAPKEFAKKDETKALHKSAEERKKLLRGAMDYLLDKAKINTGTGPKSAPLSKQNACLYAGGTLL